MNRCDSQDSTRRHGGGATTPIAHGLPAVGARRVAVVRPAAPRDEGRHGRTGREDWLVRHVPLAKRIARHLLARLPASVEFDDLLQAGMIGLLGAIERYEPVEGIPFETYAGQRIRGAMLDELRAGDELPRGVRRDQRNIEAAVHRLEQRLGHAPAAEQVARELGLSSAAYHRLLAESHAGQVVRFDELGSPRGGATEFFDRHLPVEGSTEPCARLAGRRFCAALARSMESLPSREKRLMSLRYEEDLNFREVAAVLGVTESRICQLHAQAIARLRAWLGDWVAVPADSR